MRIARGVKSLLHKLRTPVVIIGNFDGVHRGHVHLFEEAEALARSLADPAEGQAAGEVVVLTFEPHPAKVLAPAYAPPLITPLARKLELIAEAGVDVTVVEPFDRAFAAQSPTEFVDRVLVAGLGARRVCVGYDFTFGSRRSGSVQTLTELGHARGFDVTCVPAFTVDGMVCSSTKVREFVLAGRLEGARLLLGRDPEVEGVVVRGDGRGRKIGVPTANLQPESELLPKNGVYAGWAEPLDSPGSRFVAAINIGTNPTFQEGRPVTVEAHLIDTEIDLYGKRLRLGFVKRLRDEERFASVDALVAQIRRDVAETRQMISAGARR